MKLLLDENLSRRLVPFLQHDFPGTTQVALLGLQSAADRAIWEAAKSRKFVIVTRDADFEELSLVWGQPPKVIWLKGSNSTSAATLKMLLNHAAIIKEALIERNLACIEIDPAG